MAKVWRIAGWKRIEPAEDRRNGTVGPLRFVQLEIQGRAGSMRGPRDIDTQQIQVQRAALLAKKDGPTAWGIYTLLLMAAGDRSRPFRGYLLDHRNKPATAPLIARMIGVEFGLLRRSLQALASAEIGLLEKVDLPDWDALPNPHTRFSGGDEQSSAESKGPSHKDESKQKLENKEDNNQSARSPESAPHLSGRAGGNVNSNKNKNTASATPQPLTANGNGETGTGTETATATGSLDVNDGPQTATETLTGHDEAEQADPGGPPAGEDPAGQAAFPEADESGQTLPQPPPTLPKADAGGDGGGGRQGANGQAGDGRAEADEPTEADHRPGQEAEKPPSGTDGPAGSDITTAGRNGPGPPLAIMADPEGFAVRIFAAVYPNRAAVVEAARSGGSGGEAIGTDEFEAREIGCFRAAWEAAAAVGLTDQEFLTLYERAVREAELTAKKRIRPKRSRGAVWMYWFNRHMAAMVGEGRWKQAGRSVRREKAAMR